ncbi:MAG: hypothetical protein M1819_006505 [Sarea resinae]|nr:MAG: hypothetical protein M1819_006505 [Sarea resinae]
MSDVSLTKSDVRLLLAVVKNINGDLTDLTAKIDFDKVATQVPYKDAKNARAMWGRLKKKITKEDDPEGPVGDSGVGKDDGKKVTGTRKRKADAANNEGNDAGPAKKLCAPRQTSTRALEAATPVDPTMKVLHDNFFDTAGKTGIKEDTPVRDTGFHRGFPQQSVEHHALGGQDLDGEALPGATQHFQSFEGKERKFLFPNLLDEE